MAGFRENSMSFVQKKRHSCKNGCESWQKVLHYDPARGTQWKGQTPRANYDDAAHKQGGKLQ